MLTQRLPRTLELSGSNDGATWTSLSVQTAPVHLKLVRSGKDLQVFTSADGRDWGEPKRSPAAAFGEKSRIGLFVCSGNTFSTTTVVFDTVKAGK